MPVPIDDQPAPPNSNEPLGTRFLPPAGGTTSVNSIFGAAISTIRTSATSIVPGSVNQICRRPVTPTSRMARNMVLHGSHARPTANWVESPLGSQPSVSWIATLIVRLGNPVARIRHEN